MLGRVKPLQYIGKNVSSAQRNKTYTLFFPTLSVYYKNETNFKYY